MKYELTDETTKVNGITVYRIRALKDISMKYSLIQEGELGGFVESEFNLAQEGNCWISDNAVVFGNAKVYDNAEIRGRSYIFGNARIFHDAAVWDSSCFGSAWIYGEASLYDSECYGDSLIYGRAEIDRSTIRDFSRINGYSSVTDSIIGEYAQITGYARILHRSEIWGNSVISDYGSIVMGTVEHNAKISQNQKVVTSTCATDLTKDLSESIRVQTGLIPFDGQVIAYKQVRKDLTSFRDPCFQYKVGEWAIVPNAEESIRSCASGLHFANAGYWNNNKDITNSTFLIARINLEDIITVQQGKIRCRKAFILGTYDVKK